MKDIAITTLSWVEYRENCGL